MMILTVSEPRFTEVESLLINLVIAVLVGMAIGYFWYRKALRERRPTTQSWARTIVEDTLGLPKGLEVGFEGKAIPRLTETNLFFWNAGKETIRASDVTEAIRFRFEEDQTEVVRATVVKVSRKANRFQAQIIPMETQSVSCEFDYLDRRDGGAIKVLHTARFPYPTGVGEIQGVPKGITNLEPYDYQGFFGMDRHRWADRLFGVTILLAGYIYVTTGEASFPLTGNRWIDIPFLLLTSAFAGYETFMWLRQRTRRVPKSIWIQPLPKTNLARWYRIIHDLHKQQPQDD